MARSATEVSKMRKATAKRKGFVIVAVAVALVGLIAALGLAYDLGRVYIARSEAQNFTDAAAIAATLELDGTNAGITRARARVASDLNRWNFGQDTFQRSEEHTSELQSRLQLVCRLLLEKRNDAGQHEQVRLNVLTGGHLWVESHGPAALLALVPDLSAEPRLPVIDTGLPIISCYSAPTC